MAIDGVLLNRIVRMMNEDCPVKINKITQPSNHEFILHCFAGKKLNMFISTHPVFSRVQWTKEKPTANLDQTHLLTLMRKHLEGGIITQITQYGFDRVLEIHIEHRDNMGVIRPYRLVVELLGKYANIIIVDEDGVIIDALKRIAPFENASRAIVSGGLYEYPPQFDKKSFLELASYNPEDALKNQFNGISPLLEREITFRLKTQTPEAIIRCLSESQNIYLYERDFHILELTHLKQDFKKEPIMEGLDLYFKDLQQKDRIKAHTGDLLKLIKRELKRSRIKLPKLYDDYDQAQDSDYLREKGDLLFAFASTLPSGHREITVKDFEGNDVTIELDPRFNGKDNAKRYFKRYQKAKTSLFYLEEQIHKTEARIHYFEQLQTQAEQATVEDAQEISDELISLGIINQKRIRKQTIKKKKKPNYSTIVYDDETTIFIGKNNLQNDYLTFKLARKDDMWFHAANTFGAHVIIKSSELDESKIRLCAHLAAYYSKARHGSSVEVYYTQAKNIKKIPGANPGLVSISTQKSIFIDPDETLVLSYLNE